MATFTEEETKQFFDACGDDKNLEQVKEFLARGFDPDARNEFDYSPLYLAARSGKSKEIATVLTDALEQHYAHHPDLLLAALTHKAPATESGLKSAPAVIERIKGTIRHAGALSGNLEVFEKCCEDDQYIDTVREYLEHGFNPDTRNLFEYSPLYIASRSGKSKDIAAALVDALEKRYWDYPALLMASLTHKTPAVESGLKYAPEVVERINSAIRLAGAWSGDLEVFEKCCEDDRYIGTIQEYLKNGFNPDTRVGYSKKSGLNIASSKGNTAKKISELLAEASVSYYQDHPELQLDALKQFNFLASYNTDRNLPLEAKVRSLMHSAGARVGDKKIWFECCADNAYADKVKEYLDHGFDADTRDGLDYSALTQISKRSPSDKVQVNKVADLLIDALEDQYRDVPNILNGKLKKTDTNYSYWKDHPALKARIANILENGPRPEGQPGVYVAQAVHEGNLDQAQAISVVPPVKRPDRPRTAIEIVEDIKKEHTNPGFEGL